MPVEWEDEDTTYSRALLGKTDVTVSQNIGDGQWSVFVNNYTTPECYPTREAAKSAAEAEARRVLWGGLKALDAPNIKRAIAAWFHEEGEFDMADYEADMRRAFDAGMEPDNGQ